MIWDKESKPVAMCPCMLPMSPSFEVSETADELNLKVSMPCVREEDLEVTVEKHAVEVYLRQREKTVRPFPLSIDSQDSLDPERIRVESHDDVFIIGVRKVKRHRVKVG
jgi:HSP20 family molecular chaperone IbpA